jgi:multiple sugar transport system substrate-binding protein
MYKRIMLVVLVVTLASTAAWAASGDGISFMFQGPDTDLASFKSIAERFEKATGIHVELRHTSHDVYNEKVAGYVAANDLPDVMQLDAPFLSNYAWNGYIVPVAEYLDQDLIDDMTPSNIAQCTYPVDGKLYAISHIDSTVLLYGNRTYLEKIGARIPRTVAEAWSVEEFEGYLAKLAELPEVKFPLDIMRAYGVKTEWGTYAFYPALISGGGGVIDRKTWTSNGTLNSAESIRVAETFQRWAKNEWIVPASAGDNLLYNENREAAIAWCGHWMWAPAFAAMGDELVAMPLPDFGKGVVSPNGTWIYAITKNADKETAGKFLSYMLKDEQFLKEWEVTAAYPALKSWTSRYPLYADPNKMVIAAEQANVAVARPTHPAYPIITNAFMKAFDDILNGEDVKRALDDAADEIDQDIEDNDGYPPFGE